MNLDQSFQETILDLVRIILGVIVTVALPWLIVKVSGVGEWIKARVGEQRWNLVTDFVRALVRSAEQRGLTDALLKTGAARKEYVIDELQSWLDKRGWNFFDLQQLDDLVESIVFDEFNRWKSGAGAIALSADAVELPAERPIFNIDEFVAFADDAAFEQYATRVKRMRELTGQVVLPVGKGGVQ